MKPNNRTAIVSVVVVTAVLLFGLGLLSRWRTNPAGIPDAGEAPSPDRALIRLSWRFRGDRIEECRKLSEAELKAQPVHMRQPEVCEGRVASYHLSVGLQGAVADTAILTGAGAREDRPLYIFREFVVLPGDQRVSVWFAPVVPEVYAGAEAETPAEHGGAHEPFEAEPVHREIHRIEGPAELRLDTTIHVKGGDVALITYDSEKRALVVRGAATPALGTTGSPAVGRMQ